MCPRASLFFLLDSHPPARRLFAQADELLDEPLSQICVTGSAAELARTEHYHEGKVPLHTLREDIDYGFAEAKTVYGKIGVKCWIGLGQMTPEKSGDKLASMKNQQSEESRNAPATS